MSMSKNGLIQVRQAWNLLLIMQLIVTLLALSQGKITLSLILVVYIICSGIQQSDLVGRMTLGYKAYVCDDPVTALKVDIEDPRYGKKITGSYFIDLFFWIGIGLISIKYSPEPLVTTILCAIQAKLVIQQFGENPRNEVVIASHSIPIAVILTQISSSYPNYALFGCTSIVLILVEGIIIAKTDSSIKEFTKKRRADHGDSSLADIMHTAKKLLTDQEFQNSREPKELRSLFATNNLNEARNIEKYGVFPSNPIRANGIIGSLAYISRLADELDYVGYIGHRIGSLKNLDVYEIVSEDDNDWRLIFIDMYWDKRDIIAPRDLCLIRNEAGVLSAMNQFSQNFPKNFYSELIESTSQIIGIAAVKIHLKDIDFNEFERPEEHVSLLNSIKDVLHSHG